MEAAFFLDGGIFRRTAVSGGAQVERGHTYCILRKKWKVSKLGLGGKMPDKKNSKEKEEVQCADLRSTMLATSGLWIVVCSRSLWW